ncbi:hypothetical protein PSTT_03400 [Puccinia striiformis]|uniref:threonine ammonia-lyase n=1 Tax=Puccinia striiformis TaxID=27350 RepID=A0A2S4VWH4_9BASI|nr:hypothetical protein PSTT_03400 [Puccinia striiformis]
MPFKENRKANLLYLPSCSVQIRGAYNLMAHLGPEEKINGVIASSAGNHAQGVAMSAKSLGIKATIVMPLATPAIKYRNVGRLGSTVVLHGNDFDEAKRECNRLATENNRYAFLDAIFVCVGGGGLLAGIAAYVKKIGPPGLKVIGVECIDQPAMTESLATSTRLTLNEVGLFSDGTAVRVVGEETFRLCRALVDEMILVTNDELCAAIKDVFEDTRSIPEPAGALAVAGVKRYVLQNKLIGSGKRFVSIVSGANMDFDRLRFVAERADSWRAERGSTQCRGPRKTGELHSYLHPRPVTEFSYRFSGTSQAFIFVSFRLTSLSSSSTLTPGEARQQEIEGILKAVSDDPLGMNARDISNNEMAKSHARYLIGGRVAVENERLISFAFPERPGALRKFLVVLSGAESDSSKFNITLFHYRYKPFDLHPNQYFVTGRFRNHGNDLSKVLAGIQVPPAEQGNFESFLTKLGYPFTDETENEVYKEFLLAK